MLGCSFPIDIVLQDLALRSISFFTAEFAAAIAVEDINKNTLGVKKVQGQSEAALQIGMCDQKLSVEAKKLLIKNLFHYLNDIQ